MAELIRPTSEQGVERIWTTAPKTKYLPQKPSVGGMPVSDSRKISSSDASQGER